MKVKVKLFAHGDGKIRNVEIPSIDGTKEDVLNRVYHFGQNVIQPVEGRVSVSVGDVIFINDEKHIVKDFGFEKISDDFYNILEKASKISVEGPDDLKHRYDMVLYDLIGEKAFKYC